MMRAVVRLIVGLMLTLPAPLVAQGGAIRGSVVDSSGSPLPNASITVEGTNLRTTSGSQGGYEFRGVPAGRQTVRARLIGYRAASAPVTVVAGDAVRQDFTLGRSAVQLAPIDVVVGSRARHTAAEELAVPVDVYTSEDIQQQGTSETGQILAALSPSVNFPHQSFTDANDIVRPFTLRGLSPDHTLVLVNGWRQHQTALLNTFPYGSAAGSSGVDLNAIPGGAIDRIEVLRDGASTQYGSDAIAGVVNLVMKEGTFTPFLDVEAGRYNPEKVYKDDGTTVDLNGGVGIKVGRGSLGLFGEFQQRDPTNRAWPDASLADLAGVTDSVDTSTGELIQKRNGIPQPSLHWGDGLEKDAMSFVNFRMPLNAAGSSEFYAFGGYSHRVGTGTGFYREPTSPRNWPELYPDGFLPQFHPTVRDFSTAGGFRTSIRGWALDFGGSYGVNTFDYDIQNSNNPSLGPCLDTPCAPGADGVLGTADDPNIPNQLSFYAGRLFRNEILTGLNLAKEVQLGLPSPVNVAIGATFRSERYKVEDGETASWINGGHLAQDSAATPGDIAPAGSSVFAGFSPTDASNNSRNNVGAYLDLESNLSKQVLLNVAGRFEHYSDFGSRVTGKGALRFQPTKRFLVRGAISTGFRAPGLSQSFWSHTTTNFIGGQLIEVGNFPVTNRASRIFGAKPLKEETSVNLSGGFAFSPADNFTMTVDVFHIKLNDRVLLGATYDGTADTVVARILADSGITGIAAVQFFTNGLDTKTDGIDLTGDLRVPAGSGTFGFNAGINYTRNKITRVAPVAPILQNTATSYTTVLDLVTTLAIEKERPDWRGTLTTTYTNGRFHSLARASYYGKFRSAEPSFTDAESYGAKALFDAEVGYSFNQLNWSIGARNVFNTYPDQMQNPNNNLGNTFPWAAASPFGYNGRYLYTRAEMTLGW
jgi:iron complex outermembrane receptor protein